eukprot:6296257-Amphidinium_carterae.1
MLCAERATEWRSVQSFPLQGYRIILDIRTQRVFRDMLMRILEPLAQEMYRVTEALLRLDIDPAPQFDPSYVCPLK